MAHTPVLLNEVIKVLNPKDNEIFIDGTVGMGGHAKEILKHLGTNGMLIGLDADQSMLKLARENIGDDKRCELLHESYANIPEVLSKLGIPKVDGILLDIGFSSVQVDDEKRGFSFRFPDATLDMRYGKSGEGYSAKDILNKWDKDSLTYVFKKFGEERYAGRIAGKIIDERKHKEIETVGDVVNIIERAAPMRRVRGKRKPIHPATRIFQALRIAVNDELGNLESFLSVVGENINSGGRLAVISFHSLEDRIVKKSFKAFAETGMVTPISKKPITPEKEEIESNPRSRSAKLRAIEFKK